MGGEFWVAGEDGFGARYASLDEGWRNHLASVIGLPADGVQIVHGLAGSSGCERTLHRLSDAVATGAPVLRWTGAEPRSFSAGYVRLLGALRTDIDGGLEGYLASNYADWVRHRNAVEGHVSPDILFAQWAARQFGPDRARTALRFFDEEGAACAVHSARKRIAARLGHTPALSDEGRLSWSADFSATPEAARAGLFPVRDGRIAFDSSAMAGSSGGAQRAREPRYPRSGPARILPGVTDGCLDRLEQRALAGRITVEGTIGARAVIDAGPGKWFNPALVDAAREAGQDSAIWDRHSVTGRWNAFFGPSGWLVAPNRRLVFVSGLDITVTLEGPYTLAESAELAPVLRRGIWPFTSVTGQPDLVQRLQILPSGEAQVRLRQPKDATPLCCARYFPQSE